MSPNLVPNFEVKLLLDASKVLNSNGKLKDEVLSTFSIPSSTKKMNIQFVDTPGQEIYNNGWNLRIRRSEGDKSYELTYKKRYPVSDAFSATAEGNINTALEAAKQDGFDSTTPYDAQIEVGFVRQTLSISQSKEIPDKPSDSLDLPKKKKSADVLAEFAPPQFLNWQVGNWGAQHLDKSIVYGPVLAKRSKGTFEEFKLYIEVWPIRTSREDGTLVPIVEASFKADEVRNALDGRARLQALLTKKGWFLAEDSLKTKLIMERYGAIVSTP